MTGKVMYGYGIFVDTDITKDDLYTVHIGYNSEKANSKEMRENREMTIFKMNKLKKNKELGYLKNFNIKKIKIEVMRAIRL